MTYPTNQALGSYRANGASLAAENADPHRLIGMLLDRALSRLATARGHMQREDSHGRGEHISGAMAIISGLQSFLDRGEGGELADNLDALYDYMGRRLVHANLHNDLGPLEEVIRLLKEIQGAWQGIGQQVDGSSPPVSLPA